MPCAFYPERLSLSNSKHKAMDFIWGNILMGTLFTILGLAIVKSANDPNHKFMLNMPFELKRKNRSRKICWKGFNNSRITFYTIRNNFKSINYNRKFHRK